MFNLMEYNKVLYNKLNDMENLATIQQRKSEGRKMTKTK